jgi:KDO2-lipid IV(A) lauroyltransferase
MKVILDSLAYIIYFFNKEHQKIVQANLDFVYVDRLSQQEKIDIMKKSYKNIVYNAYEFIDNQNLDLEGFEKKITVKNEKYILDAIKNKRKIILVTAHYGNWEFGNTFIPLKYGPTTMVGRPMKNKYLNSELDKTRTRTKTQMLTKQEASRGLVKALKDGRILGLVIDQYYKYGIDAMFMGHKVKQMDSSSRLAAKFDAVIIPLFFTREEFGKYTAEFHKPLEPSSYKGENQIQDLTQEQVDIIEHQIMKHPDQWLWHHKRFKKYHDEIYK